MRFALLGNPNSGKTTLFNNLTGSTARVGNWPGVTVEKKVGKYKKLNEVIEIVDLPGIYSLSPYSPEEVVSRNYLVDEKPDLVINIVDATNLERNLYLTTQLLEIEVPIVIALNMYDVVEKRGNKINIEAISKKLNVKIVPISALSGRNVHELMEIAYQESKNKRSSFSILEKGKLNNLIDYTYKLLKKENVNNPLYHTIKLIESDELEIKSHKEVSNIISSFKLSNYQDDNIFKGDFAGIIADARYKYITENLSIHVSIIEEKITPSEKADNILTHRIFGLPIFFAIMFLVFHLTFSENLFFLNIFIKEGSFNNSIFGTDSINSIGVILFNLMDAFINLIGNGLASLLNNAPEIIQSLVIDGIWGGLSAVLSFIPQILCLFLFLSILEDTGYMARAAFIMDRMFRKLGLSGKSFMPLLMCFGCAVPGIMATRTLENEKERKLTLMLTPFFSCGAKLPIWGVFAAILYGGKYADLLVFSIYLLGIIVAIITALILKLTVFKKNETTFIMELPDYRIPKFYNVLKQLWDKLAHYLYRAATVILLAIIVIWFLSTFSFRFEVVEIENSILASISKSITWIFIPLGFGMGEYGWMFVVASFTGLIAKEMVPGTLGTFSKMGEEQIFGGELIGTSLAVLIGTISIPASLAFMAFNLLTVPCMAAVAVCKSEMKSRKSFWFTILFWIATSYIVSFIIYWSFTYLIVGLCVFTAILMAIGFTIYNSRKEKLC